MAARTLLRRLNHVNQRLQMRGFAGLTRPLTSVHLNQQRLTQVPDVQRYSQIRGLCCKTGDGMIINIQDENDFEERVMKCNVPVVIDFHATWCGPCKLLGPRLEALVGARKGEVILAKIDVDENTEIAMRYRIQSVPTVMGIRNQEQIDRFIGLQDDDKIETFLDKLIG